MYVFMLTLLLQAAIGGRRETSGRVDGVWWQWFRGRHLRWSCGRPSTSAGSTSRLQVKTPFS